MLFELPVELRDLVYACIFESLMAPWRHPFEALPSNTRFKPVLDLYLTCRRVYQEASCLWSKLYAYKATSYFDNIIELYELKEQIKQTPQLAALPFVLSTCTNPDRRHGDGRVFRFIEHQPGFGRPFKDIPQRGWVGPVEQWAMLLAHLYISRSSQVSSHRTFSECAASDTCECHGSEIHCPQLRSLTLPLENGSRIRAYSHNMTAYEFPEVSFTWPRKKAERLSLVLEGRLGDVSTDMPEHLMDWNYAKSEYEHRRWWTCSVESCDCLYSDWNTIDNVEVDISTWAAYEKLPGFPDSEDEDEDDLSDTSSIATSEDA